MGCDKVHILTQTCQPSIVIIIVETLVISQVFINYGADGHPKDTKVCIMECIFYLKL